EASLISRLRIAAINRQGMGRASAVAQTASLSLSVKIGASRDDSPDAPGEGVAQVSKPAVSPTSKSAARWSSDGLRIGKSATQQTWKSALLWLRLCRAALYRGLPTRWLFEVPTRRRLAIGD